MGLQGYVATPLAMELRGCLLWLMDLRTRYMYIHVQLCSCIATDSRRVLEWQGILQVSLNQLITVACFKGKISVYV